jgi:hypothetical protein
MLSDGRRMKDTTAYLLPCRLLLLPLGSSATRTTTASVKMRLPASQAALVATGPTRTGTLTTLNTATLQATTAMTVISCRPQNVSRLALSCPTAAMLIQRKDQMDGCPACRPAWCVCVARIFRRVNPIASNRRARQLLMALPTPPAKNAPMCRSMEDPTNTQMGSAATDMGAQQTHAEMAAPWVEVRSHTCLVMLVHEGQHVACQNIITR